VMLVIALELASRARFVRGIRSLVAGTTTMFARPKSLSACAVAVDRVRKLQ
jgi:hypothetical protein